MRQLAEFIKNTLIGGFFVLLPSLLFYLLFSELLEVVTLLATPIAGLFPAGTFESFQAPLVIGLLLIVAASFLLGLGLRSRFASEVGLWLERSLLNKLPLYKAVKYLSMGLLGSEASAAFRPAIYRSSEDKREIVYIIEEHGNGQLTVLLPWAPASFAGSVLIIGEDKIESLDASLDQASGALSRWGIGVADLISRSRER